MEFFHKVQAIRLRSHLDKYLIADDDGETVRQSRHNPTARRARWLVEFVDDNNSRVIRLKSCHGRYLTASGEHFLLGMTGNKVFQTSPEDAKLSSAVWEPIRDGFQVKLKASGGTYLRANGGTPPWRNSVTHDVRLSGSTQNWILWDVEAVEIPEDEPLNDYLSMISSFSSVSGELAGLEIGSPMSTDSPVWSSRRKVQSTPNLISRTGMDLFHDAKVVRLRSHHDKYLLADDDEESVIQDRNGSSTSARWTVEHVDSADHVIRLKSCYNKYLTASNQPFLLGMTGRKVLQTLPKRLDSSLEWEPIRDGNQVKLRTRYGQFLRGNGGLPPWRNSVTHDIPHRTATQDWIVWHVDVIDIRVHSPTDLALHLDSFASESSSPSTHSSNSASFSRLESSDFLGSSPPKGADGRNIFYHVADKAGNVDDDEEELCIMFKGNGVEELSRRLEEETGLENIIVCSWSPLNGKLYPLRLQLPPKNVTMHVVVVQSSSKVARDFAIAGTPS